MLSSILKRQLNSELTCALGFTSTEPKPFLLPISQRKLWLSSPVQFSLFKNQGGYFKAPEKNEEEAALNQANFDQAIMSITKDQVGGTNKQKALFLRVNYGN